MTFDEWAKSQNSKYKNTDDSMLLRQLRSCWQAALAKPALQQLTEAAHQPKQQIPGIDAA